MKTIDLKDLQHVLKHYLILAGKKYASEPIYRTAKRMADKIEEELLKE